MVTQVAKISELVGDVPNNRLFTDDNGNLLVSLASGGGGSGSDRELVVSTYRCKTAFTGASVGDTITATQVIDVSVDTPSTVSTIWRNQTTSADLAGAPAAATLELVGSAALTAAQLASAGLATLALQKDGWKSISITGRTRDPAKDLVMTFGDGTTQTLYFTTAGDWAGQSERA